jgi:Carboxylesterase family
MLTTLIARRLSSTAGVVALAFSLPVHASNPLVVKTDTGKVQGKMSADGQARDFLGIPYAAPPVGPLRWTFFRHGVPRSG